MQCKVKYAHLYDARQKTKANHNAFDMHYGTPKARQGMYYVCTYLMVLLLLWAVVCVCILLLVLANHNAWKLHYGALFCSWSWRTIMHLNCIMVRRKNHCRCTQIPSSHKSLLASLQLAFVGRFAKAKTKSASCKVCTMHTSYSILLPDTYDARQANHNAWKLHYGSPRPRLRVQGMYDVCTYLILLCLWAVSYPYAYAFCSWSWRTIMHSNALW